MTGGGRWEGRSRRGGWGSGEVVRGQGGVEKKKKIDLGTEEILTSAQREREREREKSRREGEQGERERKPSE